MIRTAYRWTLFALYQLVVAVGIVLMPVAVATRKLGVTVPLHRLVETLADAYQGAGAA